MLDDYDYEPEQWCVDWLEPCNLEEIWRVYPGSVYPRDVYYFWRVDFTPESLAIDLYGEMHKVKVVFEPAETVLAYRYTNFCAWNNRMTDEILEKTDENYVQEKWLLQVVDHSEYRRWMDKRIPKSADYQHYAVVSDYIDDIGNNGGALEILATAPPKIKIMKAFEPKAKNEDDHRNDRKAEG